MRILGLLVKILVKRIYSQKFDSLNLRIGQCQAQSLIFFIDQSIYRSSRPEVFCENVFLEISQNSQENTCARDSFLIKLQALGLKPATLLKSFWHKCFPVNFAKFLRTPFFKEHLQWLHLNIALREKCPNTALFLVRIWTLFTQCRFSIFND